MTLSPYSPAYVRHLSLLTTLKRVHACACLAPDMRKLFMHEREELNKSDAVFPGSNLRLRYAIRPAS